MTKLHELANLGQSIWLDYIRRSFIESGDLSNYINLGLLGMTSNPTIFDKAISGSTDYDADIEQMAIAGRTVAEIYTALTLSDIQSAADQFRPVYDRTNGGDGYISLEVDPRLANDTQTTISEARRLWALVNRPNLMIKIPATHEGLPAITQVLADGINVNVTLIFSLSRYDEVMEAYLRGLEQRLEAGYPIDHLASVASFFISRVDNKVDRLLMERCTPGNPQAAQAQALLGKAAVANAKMAYQNFKTVFNSSRFTRLQTNGARVQRPLWASTSTKNPLYSDILYVQELIGLHTINTTPQETLEAFVGHGEPRLTIEEHIDQARVDLNSLAQLGISMDQVTQELEIEGVSAFIKSFNALLSSLAQKRTDLLAKQPRLESCMGLLESTVLATMHTLESQRVLPRIWESDYTVWKPLPTEITNRLGWLRTHEEMLAHLPEIQEFVDTIQNDGYTQAVLLGMGGSSLAPELFSLVFSPLSQSKVLVLEIQDSTDPGAVLSLVNRLDLAHTLFIVSTKSGSTEETLSFFKFFYNRLVDLFGPTESGRHFIAITDPGSALAAIAQAYAFRHTFLANPNIGGRFSALSHFGVVPAALCGVDLPRLLDSAQRMAVACGPLNPLSTNPALRLGAILGELARIGRDKVAFLISPAIASFGDWVEQLIAESTGKEGCGILPVINEPPITPHQYGADRLFIRVGLRGESTSLERLRELEAVGQPVINIELENAYELGGQFLLWGLAVAIASARLGINPFDQPNVESAKKAARAMVAAYRKSGLLSQESPILQDGMLDVYGAGTAASARQALVNFLSQARPGDYIALQAFLQPTPENTTALMDLRKSILMRTRLATTLGYGPRFLHSTGQLHKGDSGHGLFIQFTYTPSHDVQIPLEAGLADSAITFGVLELAQALGDRQALLGERRRVLRIHFKADPASGLRTLV